MGKIKILDVDVNDTYISNNIVNDDFNDKQFLFKFDPKNSLSEDKSILVEVDENSGNILTFLYLEVDNDLVFNKNGKGFIKIQYTDNSDNDIELVNEDDKYFLKLIAEIDMEDIISKKHAINFRISDKNGILKIIDFEILK